MTRGYFVITDCSKITDVAIIWGGTRPENAGASILEALRTLTRQLQIASPVTRVKTLITTMTSATP